MPIARTGTFANAQATNGSSSYTLACDVGSSSNRVLAVGVGIGDTTSDVVTGVTYAGTSMTRADFVGAGSIGVYMYILVNPTSGSNNIVVSLSGGHNGFDVSGQAYSGAAQSGQPDSHATTSKTAPATSPLTATTTVVASNCWLVAFADQTNPSGFPTSAGTGTSQILQQLDSSGVGTYDSNGTVGTGSQSLQETWSNTNDHFVMVVASIAPGNNAFSRSLSDSILNGASRSATVGRVVAFSRSLSDTISVAASRLATIARKVSFFRSISDSTMNAAARLATVARIKGSVRALSDSIMVGAARVVTLSRVANYGRALSDSIMNAASRFARLLGTFRTGFTMMRSNQQSNPVTLDQATPDKMKSTSQTGVPTMDDIRVL